MRIKESKLRRIIRKTLVETFSDSQSIMPMSQKSELGRLPVEIDPSRHTHQSDPILDIRRAIEKEDLTREEMRELLQVLHRLNDCMAHNDEPGVCADKIFDAGLENAFHELGYILHDLSLIHI